MQRISSNQINRQRLKKSHNLYLGVDGGGTKTQIALLDDDKKVVCEGFAGASNPLRVGIETAVANILAAINNACDTGNKNQGDIVSATLGLAGVRREDLRQRVRESFNRNLQLKRVEVYTDAEIALYGAAAGKAALVVIAGTGSICIGQNDRGMRASAGGWGPLAGDEGGGAGIARRALQAIAKASDGRGKQTRLSEDAIEYFRAGRLEDLSVAIYAPQIDNARIAGFAKFVIEAAQDDDEIAIEILREAAGELALAANTVIHELKLERKKFPIARVGGIFRGGNDLITKPFMETVQAVAPKAFLAEPFISPAVAAAQMAFETYKKGEKQ